MPRNSGKRKPSIHEAPKKAPTMRKGPQIPTQNNTHLIDQTIAESSRMSIDQRRELVAAGTGDEMPKKAGRLTITIDKIPTKTTGGSVIHHCGRNMHNTQKQCIDGGCIIACPVCGSWISAWGNSKCRTCQARQVGERLDTRARIEEEEEQRALDAEAAEKEAGSKKQRKPKWGGDKKEERQRVLQAGHEADLSKARAGAHKAVVLGSRVPKRRGRAGHKGRGGEHEREDDSADDNELEPRKRKTRMTRKQEHELTLKAALVLWEYCQDYIRAAYSDVPEQE